MAEKLFHVMVKNPVDKQFLPIDNDLVRQRNLIYASMISESYLDEAVRIASKYYDEVKTRKVK